MMTSEQSNIQNTMMAVADILANAVPSMSAAQAPVKKKPSGTKPSSKRTLPYNCERCRKDKTKCDKTWPKCRRCKRKGYECVSVMTKRGRPAKKAEEAFDIKHLGKRKIATKIMPAKRYVTSKKLRHVYEQQQQQQQLYQNHLHANIATNNIMAMQGGGTNAMRDTQAIDLLRSAASLELLSENNMPALQSLRQGELLAQQQRQQAAALLAHQHQQQQQLLVQQQVQAAASLANQRNAFEHSQRNILSGYAAPPSQIHQQQVILDPKRNVKAVARSLLLSNMWVYFRDQDYQGIAQGYIAVSKNIAAEYNMRKAFSLFNGVFFTFQRIINKNIFSICIMYTHVISH